MKKASDNAAAEAVDTVGSADTLASRIRATGLSAFYDAYYSDLLKGLRSTYGAGPPDPEDVAQQAFLKLAEAPDLDTIRSLENYVWICARNVYLSEKRAYGVRARNRQEVTRRMFGSTCDEFDPERVLNARQQIDVVMDTLSKMPERRQQIFLLNRVHGLTPAEAGRRCGVSRTAAVRHIAIATSTLATALVRHNDGESDLE